MAQIKLHAGTWNGLTADQQKEIQDILSATGLGDPVADAAAPAPGATRGLGVGLCSLLCTMAQTAAKIGCAKLSSPAKELCEQGADVGFQICTAKCH